MIKVIKYCIKIKIPAIRIDSKKAVERAKTKTLNVFMLFFSKIFSKTLKLIYVQKIQTDINGTSLGLNKD